VNFAALSATKPVDRCSAPHDLWQPQTIAATTTNAIYLLPQQCCLWLLQGLCLLFLLLQRVLCVETGVEMRATKQHATDERLTQTQRQHRVRHVDEDNAT